MNNVARWLPRARIVDREALLLKAAKGVSVLHLGCADAPLFRVRAAQGTLLHPRLAAVAREIVGVDLDREGVEFLRTELGLDGIIHWNVEALAELSLDRKFDLVIAGELLEHLPNPGLCLTGVRRFLRHEGSLIVTVPNALSLKVLLRALVGREAVNSDHLTYFSPVTIVRLLETCAYTVISRTYYVSSSASKLKYAADRSLLRLLRGISPCLSDGLVVEARVI